MSEVDRLVKTAVAEALEDLRKKIEGLEEGLAKKLSGSLRTAIKADPGLVGEFFGAPSRGKPAKAASTEESGDKQPPTQKVKSAARRIINANPKEGDIELLKEYFAKRDANRTMPPWAVTVAQLLDEEVPAPSRPSSKRRIKAGKPSPEQEFVDAPSDTGETAEDDDIVEEVPGLEIHAVDMVL